MYNVKVTCKQMGDMQRDMCAKITPTCMPRETYYVGVPDYY